MAADVLLELDHARVVRDGREILCVDHLIVYPGEHLAILGPNGAGKSTLVSLLTGDVKPLWAEEPPIRFRGRRLWDLAEARRDIGVVSHRMQGTLDRGINARDAVVGGLFGAVGVPIGRHPTSEHIAAADRALDRLGMLDLAERRMSTLSTGEARRVVIARALVHDPAVLVLDEPTAGLDPGAAFHVRKAVSALMRHGVTLLLVTHHVEDIPPEVERALLLAEGRITADGNAAELLTGDRLSALFGARLGVEHDSRGWRLT